MYICLSHSQHDHHCTTAAAAVLEPQTIVQLQTLSLFNDFEMLIKQQQNRKKSRKKDSMRAHTSH